MRTYLEGLAVFGVSGLTIVFFALCWAVTDLDALTIMALDYILMSTVGLAVMLKINDFVRDIKRKEKESKNGRFKQSNIDRIRN
nr:MAG TPA: hypothetical protein [Caudoviricetes sp.]